MEEKVLLYSQLSAAERREVELYVGEYPEFASLLEESRAFEALLREAQLLQEDPPGDEALAYYLVTRHLGRYALPPSLQEAFGRIEVRLQEEPVLQTRGEEMARRLAALEAGTDAAAQFERLTGHTLHSLPSPAAPSADDLYQEALPLLQQARRAPLGLFPHYDVDRLRKAAALLERVAGQAQGGTPLQLQATYLLGKVRLLQGDAAGARTALQAVVAERSWRADAAAALLVEATLED